MVIYRDKLSVSLCVFVRRFGDVRLYADFYAPQGTAPICPEHAQYRMVPLARLYRVRASSSWISLRRSSATALTGGRARAHSNRAQPVQELHRGAHCARRVLPVCAERVLMPT
jgi:hypothetical protein